MKKVFRPFISYITISLFIIGYMVFQNIGYTDYIAQTHIGIKLINSYSGFISRNTGQNIISSGGSLWTNTITPSITISANTGSDFMLSGDVGYLIGSGIGNYSIPTTLSLYSGDTIKHIQTIFSRNGEPYNSNILDIILDTTAPSLPTIGGPYNNEVVSGVIMFSWTESYDYGIGLSHYNIHLSLDPGFLGEIIIPSTSNNLQIPGLNLPEGTLFWYIEAVDSLGNSIHTNPFFFHNGQASTIDGGGSSHGGSNYSGGGGTNGSYNPYNTHTNNSTGQYNTGSHIITGSILSGTIVLHNTGIYLESGYKEDSIKISEQGQKNTIKNILLYQFHSLNKNERGNISIPTLQEGISEHNSATIQPDAVMYNNLLGLYYYHLNPLGYTMNIISWLLIPFYYLIQGLQYYLITSKKNHI